MRAICILPLVTLLLIENFEVNLILLGFEMLLREFNNDLNAPGRPFARTTTIVMEISRADFEDDGNKYDGDGGTMDNLSGGAINIS